MFIIVSSYEYITFLLVFPSGVIMSVFPVTPIIVHSFTQQIYEYILLTYYVSDTNQVWEIEYWQNIDLTKLVLQERL